MAEGWVNLKLLRAMLRGEGRWTATKHLYGHVLCDSANAESFAKDIDVSAEVAAHEKLPSGFYIGAPVANTAPTGRLCFMKAR
jgi:hypothetical protein